MGRPPLGVVHEEAGDLTGVALVCHPLCLKLVERNQRPPPARCCAGGSLGSDRCCFGLPPAKFKNEWNSAVGRPPLGGVQEEAGDLTDSVPLGDEAEPAVHTSGGRGCSVPLGNGPSRPSITAGES